MTAVDTLGFVDAVGTLPEQFGEALATAGAADLSGIDAGAITNIAVAGMGGSGISGDVLATAGSSDLTVPVTVLKQYRVPRFVGPGTLFFAMSYSGGTEETLEATAAAVSAGAQVVAVSSGGELAELAAKAGAPVIGCPPGFMPRAALGHLATPLFVVCERLGLLPGGVAAVESARAQAARRRDACRPQLEGQANPARELARRIGRTFPLVWGTGAMGAVAAYRWKADVNENAKAPAFSGAFPELDHNEICAFGQHGDVTRQVVTLVELRHDHEHPQLRRRVEATRAIVEETVASVLEVRAEGDGRLAQLVDLMYLGDWVSVYMALDAGVDPGPIDAIARLKTELAR
ncbi:MAG TPA: bifunctional phosphoglucose/phosphomannose isomerase [Acidimicrobiia bacterium]|nr:bifunctional phosphoglucose/phosphomannose isomerase [Acidimicrobiia bacterium]